MGTGALPSDHFDRQLELESALLCKGPEDTTSIADPSRVTTPPPPTARPLSPAKGAPLKSSPTKANPLATKMSDMSDLEYDSTGGYEDDEDGASSRSPNLLSPVHLPRRVVTVMDYESDFGSGDEEDVSGFDMVDTVSNLKEKQKAYEVDFTVLSEDELSRRQNDEIEQVSSIIGIKRVDAALLLRYFAWNKDILIEKYMVRDSVLQFAVLLN